MVLQDDRLFAKIENNKLHVLYNCLPSKKETGYNMRKRKHSIPLTSVNTIETLSTAFSSKIYIVIAYHI